MVTHNPTSALSPEPAADDTTAADAVAGPMHAAIDHAAAALDSTGQRLSEGVTAARSMLDDCIDEARLLGNECIDKTRAKVRARPLTAIVTALAIGLLLGRMGR